MEDGSAVFAVDVVLAEVEPVAPLLPSSWDIATAGNRRRRPKNIDLIYLIILNQWRSVGLQTEAIIFCKLIKILQLLRQFPSLRMMGKAA